MRCSPLNFINSITFTRLYGCIQAKSAENTNFIRSPPPQSRQFHPAWVNPYHKQRNSQTSNDAAHPLYLSNAVVLKGLSVPYYKKKAIFLCKLRNMPPIAYLILWKFAVDKVSIIGVAFWGIFSWLTTGFNLFRLSLLFLHSFLEKSVVGTLIRLSLTLRSLESLYKNIQLKISIIGEAKKIWVQNPPGGFFNFCKINV